MNKEKQDRYDFAYLKLALEWANLSYCNRKKVGALIVKDRMIISDGYNGSPSGFDNLCEDENGDKKNLAGYSVAAKLKKNYNSDSSDTHDFTTSINAPTTDGIIQLNLPNATTDALKAGRYVYDVEISFQDSDNTTVIERILEGRIQVTPSVTK